MHRAIPQAALATGLAGLIALLGASSALGARYVPDEDASVDDKGAPGRDPQFGFGRVNALEAVTP